jgi:hypothetical protein
MSALAPYRKALLAFFVAAIPVLLSNIGSDGLELQDWLQALAAGVVGLGAVYAIPNATPVVTDYPPQV